MWLAATLGPQNWARWGYGCIIGVVLFGAYGIIEHFYNRKHGTPNYTAFEDGFSDGYCNGQQPGAGDAKGVAAGAKDGAGRDLETGGAADGNNGNHNKVQCNMA